MERRDTVREMVGAELLILLSATLAAGKSRLEIATQFAGSVTLKTPRKTTFDQVLTVK